MEANELTTNPLPFTIGSIVRIVWDRSPDNGRTGEVERVIPFVQANVRVSPGCVAIVPFEHLVVLPEPVRAVEPEIVKTLKLGRNGLTCIGYWRSSEAGGGSPYHRGILTAEAGVRGEGHQGMINGMAARDYYAIELPLRREQAAAIDQLPWPGDHVDPSMPEAERERVALLLDSAPDLGGYMGSSNDRLSTTHELNGSRENGIAGFIWPNGLSTYVRKYGLLLDPEILTKIEAALIEQAEQVETERCDDVGEGYL